MKLDKDILTDLYKKILLARRFEERVSKLIVEGVVLGSVHLSIGEEAAAVGTIGALEVKDYILPTHRGHAQVLAKGADPLTLMAELAAKETGYSKGMCGSIHLFDRKNNNLGSNGIVGAQFPITVGIGLAIKHKKSDSLVACFFGDGSTNQGWFYELLNLVSLWSLPVILVCINNSYGMGTHYSKTSTIEVHEKSKAFKIKSEIVDGNNIVDVYLEMKKLTSYARKYKKPALIECLTYRQTGHSAHDNRPYRPDEEIKAWKARDPLKIAKNGLLESGATSESLKEMEKDIKKIIDDAERFARESKFPVFNDAMQL
jgi:TPP-dependent pyruvate/acetoin dehydrogenase alpha subunit